MLSVALAALMLLAAPAAWSKLGVNFQAPLGNPDGASTNAASRTKFLINQRAQYVISYNDDTHQANWVGWSYSLADDGTQARTDFWQTEELLPSGYLKIGTATFGTGWDRGHMTPSADRTKDLTNNQVTFRMSNIIPQASQNNQGLWANFEDYCRTLAADGDEIVIISGPAQFNGSRLNNQMSVPGSVWKIAVEIPNATSPVPANERITTGARVIALLTPNTSTGLGPWQSYITSVEQIEDVTGFNFFTAITNQSTAIYLKNLVDTGTGPNNPTVITTFNPTLGTAGTAVTISGFNFGTSPVVQFNGTTAAVQSATANTISVQVPAGATSGYITVQGTSGTDTSYEPFTVSATVVPTLSLSPAALSGLTANQGSPGVAVPYALTGSNLTNSVTVTAPANFEVSKDGGSTFANTLTLSNDITGSLGAQLFARVKAGASAGNASGTITHTSGGATTANLAVSGSVLSAAPSLSLSTNTISGLTALQNSTGTTAASYTVSGANLTGNITVSASAGLEISTNNVSFASSVSLSPSSGVINAATVHVRLAASATAGGVSGTISHSGGGLATPQSVSVSGSVTSTDPSLVLSTTAIGGLTAVQNSPGGSKTYTISGTFLTGAVSVGAPAGFEVGTNTTTFGSSLTLSPSSGTLATTTIYARLASSATTGAKSGTITHTGGGASQQNVAVTGTVNTPGSGETSTAIWDFTTASPASGVPAGVAVGAVSQGNNNGTTTMITSTSASSGYTGASGGNNAGAAARTGALNTNASGSAYFQFTITPTNGATFSVTDLSFGSRSTTTGPTAYVLRSSADNFTANIASGTFTADSAWRLLTHSGITASGSIATIFRLYGHSGTGSASANTANWRIDDLKVTISTGTSGPVDPKPVITSATTASGTAYSPFSYQITADNKPTYFSASGLPEGLSINNTSGLISGTPTIAGTFSIMLTASNGSGDGTKTLSLTVAPQPAPAITSATTATDQSRGSRRAALTGSVAGGR